MVCSTCARVCACASWYGIPQEPSRLQRKNRRDYINQYRALLVLVQFCIKRGELHHYNRSRASTQERIARESSSSRNSRSGSVVNEREGEKA